MFDSLIIIPADERQLCSEETRSSANAERARASNIALSYDAKSI